jgi:hypothetical protein
MDAMFARYFIELDRPHTEVEAALLEAPPGWLDGFAEAADDRGRRLLIDVGVGSVVGRIGKQVELEVGAPARLPSRTIVPLTWKATGPTVLFPGLAGDLEVASLGPEHTQLSLSASYRPPLGQVGELVDRVLLHRLAEATIKDFLDRLGAALGDGVARPGLTTGR